MPSFFGRRKKKQQSNPLAVRSAEQLSSTLYNNNRHPSVPFSDARLSTDRQQQQQQRYLQSPQPLHPHPHRQPRPPVHHHHNLSQPPLQQPPPPPQQQQQQPIRRAQTHHISLDLPPDPSTTNTTTAAAPPTTTTTSTDDQRKLQKKKTILNRSPPLSSSPSPSSSSTTGFRRSLSVSAKGPRSKPFAAAPTAVSTPASPPAVNPSGIATAGSVTGPTATTTTTPTPTGGRRPLRESNAVVTSQSIPEIATPGDTPQQQSPVSTSTSTSTTAASTNKPPTTSDNLLPDSTTQFQFPFRSPSQQSFTPSVQSVTAKPDSSAETMAGPQQQSPPAGAGAGAGRQSPHAQENKNISRNSLEQGRGTPGPGQKREEDTVNGLAQRHDELLAKYAKVKRYYFEKEAQVQHLQNTVAHQRMAVSRTVLDDNEYSNRFGRLDGAIKDLAFSVRKDWNSLPQWLIGHVNDDAHTVGTKEMTGIGRAVISRWLVEEIFQRHFHPALEPTLSQQLKSIENNIRYQHNTKATPTEEDKENTIAKISNWRRTTFDGLGEEQLHSQKAEDNRANLIEHLVAKLVATLEMHLTSPPPPGMDNSARLIIENAIGIAEKIPLESRDIGVEYPLPGTPLDDRLMRPESGVPPLTNVKPENRPPPSTDATAGQAQGPAGAGDSRWSLASDATVQTDLEKRPSISAPSPTPSGPSTGPGPGPATTQQPEKKKSSSVFNALMGRRSSPTSSKDSNKDANNKDREEPPGTEPAPKREGRIRFAAFMSAEVRGKGPTSVLAKAPVYFVE